MLSDSRIKQIKELLKLLGIKSKNYQLINQALTHSSYIFENNTNNIQDYERLEFLGDSVLKIHTSKYLYDKFPDYNEGELTKIRAYLVSDNFIFKLAQDISLEEYINLGTQEEKTGGRKRKSILACAFEALLGAFYEDEIFNETYTLLDRLYSKYIDEIAKNIKFYNAKAILQEYTQAKSKELPEYIVKKESGKAHDKSYEIEVKYKNKIMGKGSGKSKKEAEQNAAMSAVKKLGLVKE